MKHKIIYFCLLILFMAGLFVVAWFFIHNPDKIYTSNFGFSFKYPNDMYIQDASDGASDNFRVLIIPKLYRDDQNQPLTAVVVSASLNNTSTTPLEWLYGPDSGADMSKGYTRLNLDGQEAISVNNDNWVVVDAPGDKYQISIATLPGENPSQSLKKEMDSIVASFAFAK